MAAPMHIEEQRVANVTILRLTGRLELDDGDVVLRDCVNRLVEQGRVNIVLDMKGVTRLDSAGIGMLVGKYLTAKKCGGAIALLHLTDRTNHLLQITRLAGVFETFEHQDDAVRSFGVTA